MRHFNAGDRDFKRFALEQVSFKAMPTCMSAIAQAFPLKEFVYNIVCLLTFMVPKTKAASKLRRSSITLMRLNCIIDIDVVRKRICNTESAIT
jgi:hypothetical protein